MSEHEEAGERTSLGRVVALNRDLFFGVRIANTLRPRGFDVSVVPKLEPFLHALSGADVALGIVDIGIGVDWDRLADVIARPGMPPILAFGPHVDVDGLRAAKRAGARRVVSNGDFHRDMIALVERYARPVDPKEPGGPSMSR